MTLNGVMVIILRHFTVFGSSQGQYVKVVEDRPEPMLIFVYFCSLVS